MDFKKCARCGCFFASESNTCGLCSNKDKAEMSKLKTYLEENEANVSLDQLSYNTGITEQNLHRYLQDNTDFSDIRFQPNTDTINIATIL